jgi:FMN phosphatase YigB (HAD superfamily)
MKVNEATEDSENKLDLYCDMDGVIVDFDTGYHKLTGTDLSGEFRSDPAFWEPINNAGVKFWEDLDWMPDGKRLWKYIEKYNPIILSAPSNRDESRVGKQFWVKRELPGVHLYLRYAKHKIDFATPHSVLIDDRLPNIEDWINAGGIGIHHTSTESTIHHLKKLGL